MIRDPSPGAQGTPSGAELAWLRGGFSGTRLGALLQMLEIEGLTGRLCIGDVAWIDVDNGAPVAAEWGDLHGVDVIFELFMVSSGAFRFDATAVAPARPLGRTAQLVMVGAYNQDNWGMLGPCVLVRGSPERLVSSAGLMAPESALARTLDQLDGQRTLAEAVLAAGVRRSQVIDRIQSLVADGALCVVGEPRPETVPALHILPSVTRAATAATADDGRERLQRQIEALEHAVLAERVSAQAAQQLLSAVMDHSHRLQRALTRLHSTTSAGLESAMNVLLHDG